MKQELLEICVRPQDTMRSVFEIIQKSHYKLCLVTDSDHQVLGTITDGDCRRCLLSGGSLETPAEQIMNTDFLMVETSFSFEQITSLMRVNKVDKVPIVDKKQRLVDLATSALMKMPVELRANPVLILAGGRGTRLLPLTKDVPKPMLPVQGRPMLEHLIQNLVSQYFLDINISINYLGYIIKEHFQDGAKVGCRIHYLEEETALGTAGPLTLLHRTRRLPILVTNGDLVTNVNFGALIDFHDSRKYDMTIGMSNHRIEIPFGVIDMHKNGEVRAITEKPVHSLPVNAGLYVINPDLVEHLSPNEPCAMTEFIARVISRGAKVGAFPVHETWLDVGMPAQYELAQTMGNT